MLALKSCVLVSLSSHVPTRAGFLGFTGLRNEYGNYYRYFGVVLNSSTRVYCTRCTLCRLVCALRIRRMQRQSVICAGDDGAAPRPARCAWRVAALRQPARRTAVRAISTARSAGRRGETWGRVGLVGTQWRMRRLPRWALPRPYSEQGS